MHLPESYAAYARLAAGYARVPVCRAYAADGLTPVAAYQALRDGTPSFLLESVIGGERAARYSFVGRRPIQVLRARPGDGVDPFGLMEAGLGFDREGPGSAALDPRLPRFTGGAVGYLGYDAVRWLEHLPDRPRDRLGLPTAEFGIFDTVTAFDRVTGMLLVLAWAHAAQQGVRRAWQDAHRRIEETVADLERAPAPGALAAFRTPAAAAARSNMGRERYEDAVRRVKRYIRAGDVFQCVLSQRFSAPLAGDPLDVYRSLRLINPSPYLYFLEFEDLTLIGSSPEVLVRVEDGTAVVRPIAGTRRRGLRPEEDAALAAELLADPKERAEHLMLLDLARNDLGRVCEYGSVAPAEVMTVENYSHVMHITSEVRGRLRKGTGPVDALRVAFPAGTVSGAPKVRAMEIIDELEPEARGPYAGAVGYLDYAGRLDTAIAIRTLVVHQGRAYAQAGAGIVADSVPAKEYDETVNKAKALLTAVKASRGNGKGSARS